MIDQIKWAEERVLTLLQDKTDEATLERVDLMGALVRCQRGGERAKQAAVKRINLWCNNYEVALSLMLDPEVKATALRLAR